MAAEPEAVLLARYSRDQDAEAFRSLVQLHQGMVYSACRRILGNRADAEDAAQNCFLKLARKAQELRAPLAGWLHRVAVTGSMDLLRRRRARATREARAARPVADAAEASWDDVKDAVDEAVAALPDELQVPLVLYFLEGRSQGDIAEELGISQPAVSQRLKKGVALLRERLRERGHLVSGAALGAMLAHNAVEAAPATLAAALGKMAMAGVRGAATSAGPAVGLVVCVVVAAVAIAVLAVVVLASVLAGLSRPKAQPAPAVRAVARPAPATGSVDIPRAVPPRTLAAAPPPDKSRPGPGPESETVLNSDGAGQDMFIDFDTGRLFSLPAGMVVIEPMLSWMRRNGIDAVYAKDMDPRALLGADLAVVSVAAGEWDSLTVERLARIRLPLAKPAFPVRMAAGLDLPVTFIFRTRGGNVGALQILGFDSPARSIRLRYRIRAAAMQ
jgi:RNA polymerase sigma factor (sigma-70 family)